MSGRPALRCALLIVALASCGGGGNGSQTDAAVDAPVDAAVDAPVDAFVIPALRNPVDLDDATLAMQASQLMGQDTTKNCDRCHALSRTRYQAWQTETNAAISACFTNLSPTTQAEAMAIIDCLRETPGDATSRFSPARLGVYATGGDLAWFRYVFHLAYGAAGDQQLGFFEDEALMPRGGAQPFTQAEFDLVAEWFARGLPQLDDVIPADPPPGTCTESITPEVATHIMTMHQEGWRALDAEAGLDMFGCAGAQGPRACLASYPGPADQAWSTGWDSAEPTSNLRILREQIYSSAYWTRGSADGRYVAQGGGTGASPYRATVIDLLQNREIPAAAQYDPAFTPDNSAFMLQGSSAKICEQSLLSTSPAMITFNEPQCSQTNAIGLYQHIGASRGGDYWAVSGQFVSDNSGHGVTLNDPQASSNSTAKITLTPFVHTGTSFMPRTGIQVTLPREGDVVLSGTTKLLISRINGGNNSQVGYLMRKMIATADGAGYHVDTPEIARYCLRGGKPAFSYDDRWIVYHHLVEANDWASLGYTSATDPGFVALRMRGASNIYLLDPLSGVSHRLTTMNPGQYALYPFFRADGWIYFLVRDTVRSREELVATDAALAYEGL
ncbi:MAG TPA: hypothetical protein VHE35_33565 [Kofleriaceae bacterium]|nr:hypothetical protein [Kofleriaceae bacterium]